jgi:hypothetical protein
MTPRCTRFNSCSDRVFSLVRLRSQGHVPCSGDTVCGVHECPTLDVAFVLSNQVHAFNPAYQPARHRVSACEYQSKGRLQPMPAEPAQPRSIVDRNARDVTSGRPGAPREDDNRGDSGRLQRSGPCSGRSHARTSREAGESGEWRGYRTLDSNIWNGAGRHGRHRIRSRRL